MNCLGRFLHGIRALWCDHLYVDVAAVIAKAGVEFFASKLGLKLWDEPNLHERRRNLKFC